LENDLGLVFAAELGLDLDLDMDLGLEFDLFFILLWEFFRLVFFDSIFIG
jgi:hypothetical protein